MSTSKRVLGELESINLSSGVSAFTGEGFCAIHIDGFVNKNPVRLRGQLNPTEVRGLALAWLEGSEAAESDAAVRAVFVKLGLPDEVWGRFIIELRKEREIGLELPNEME